MSWRSFLGEDVPDYIPRYIVGIDEVGRGCIAGPVVTCGVMMPADWWLEGLKDSKAFTGKKRHLKRKEVRDRLLGLNVRHALYVGDPRTIDSLGIDKATMQGFLQNALELTRDFDPLSYLVILDGDQILDSRIIKSVCRPKADGNVPHVMAASIIAKVTRDMMMLEEHVTWPVYGFNDHMGYPTKEHLKALKEYGHVQGLHRTSFGPVKEIM